MVNSLVVAVYTAEVSIFTSMTKEEVLEWVGDHILNHWWVRFLVIPAIGAAPTALASLAISLGDKTIDGYKPPYIVLGAACWALFVSAAIAGLDRAISIPAERLKQERVELLRLIGYVRYIVGFKSHRFHASLLSLPDPVDAGEAFLLITQPDAQIREIIRAIHDFFKAEAEPDEAIKVSVMEWNEARCHLMFLAYYPDSEPPKARPEAFKDNSTIAGRAFFDNNVVVCEDIDRDPRYQRFGNQDRGSLFAYPVYDADRKKVTLIVNVVSSKVKRFRIKNTDALRIPMHVFGERMLLEYRLRELRSRVEQSREVAGSG